MEGGPSVAREDGASVSTASRALVVRVPETSVTNKDGLSFAKEEEEIPPFVEVGASVAREDRVSVTG